MLYRNQSVNQGIPSPNGYSTAQAPDGGGGWAVASRKGPRSFGPCKHNVDVNLATEVGHHRFTVDMYSDRLDDGRKEEFTVWNRSHTAQTCSALRRSLALSCAVHSLCPLPLKPALSCTAHSLCMRTSWPRCSDCTHKEHEDMSPALFGQCSTCCTHYSNVQR